MYPLDECKKEITQLLQNTLTPYKIPFEIRIEIPPGTLGDFAFPCFPLAPLLKKAPQQIAQDIARTLPQSPWVKRVEAQAGYVNFFIDTNRLAVETLSAIQKQKDTYGHLKKKNKKVIIEHTSANPNGPLHVGR
ncbi:MAG: Arginyl-tRNA synthetase, partial [Thermoplasmatales archaeon]|nr:Arginyl-tRNA synthetase [Thermoplasmatales archaeon]